MSFASLQQPAIGPVIERFAGASDMTLLVGAGASMEAGLPSWPTLIESLLSTVAKGRDDLPTAELEDEWKRLILRRDDLLGAGAVVEVLATEPLEQLVPDQLYGPSGPAGYLPGPIAEQVATLRRVFCESLEILTTNYDDLIERALIDTDIPPSRIRSYCTYRSAGKRAAKTTPVTHLHGLAGREGPPKGIVLTEEHYHRMQHGISWQERFVTQRLEESLCLFVGMSMADPNLIRYLYGYEVPADCRHAAIFVRQAEPDCTPEIRPALEEAAAKRWARCGIEAIFVDHYADAAQLLHEIGHCRQLGEGYEPLGARAERLIGYAEGGLAAGGKRDKFGERQVELSHNLRNLLDVLLIRLFGELPDEESLGLSLWLFSGDGKGLTSWAHSDRAHQDPATIGPVPLDDDSDWVAVRAVCRGVRVELNRDNYASRWRFVRGLPIVLDKPARIPIGCLTVASTKPGPQSVLTSMPESRRAAFHDALSDAGRRFVQVLISIGEAEERNLRQ